MKNPETTREKIPQILTLVKIPKNGNMNLRKAIRQHLGLNRNRTLYLDTSHEIIITSNRGKGKRIAIDDKNRISLPDEGLEKLQIVKDSLIGLVERGRGLAMKSFKIREKQGEAAKWYVSLIEKVTYFFYACPMK